MTDNQEKAERKQTHDTRSYRRTKMQKENIVELLKKKGCRITQQRLIILDIILENECSCCKEIYFKASQVDRRIGTATVYRMVNALEEIGAISRKNMYKVAYSDCCTMEEACVIVLDDDTTYQISAQKWNAIIKAGLHAFGYLQNQNIESVTISGCECASGTC